MLIAAHISRAGVCASLLEDVLLHHDLIVSEFVLEELARKLRQKFAFPSADSDQVVAFLRNVGVVVVPSELPADSCRDPADIPILGTALAGRCDLLVSVDRDLLDLASFRGIAIVRPGEFWRRTAT